MTSNRKCPQRGVRVARRALICMALSLACSFESRADQPSASTEREYRKLSIPEIAELLENLPTDPEAIGPVMEVAANPTYDPAQRKTFLSILIGIPQGLGFTLRGPNGFAVERLFVEPTPEAASAILRRVMWMLDSDDALVLGQVAGVATIEMFNYLHDNDPELLDAEIGQLSARGAYLLLAKGEGFYTATFELLWDRFREVIDARRIPFDEFLDIHDPERAYLADYVLTLGSYRQAEWLFTVFPEVLDEVERLLVAETSNVIVLSSSFKSMLASDDPNLDSLRASLESMLLSSHAHATGEPRLALGLLLRLLRDEFSEGRRETIDARTRDLGKVDSIPRRIPHDRLANEKGEIEIAVSFEPSSIYYLDVFRRLLTGKDPRFPRVGGYRVTSSFGDGFVAEKTIGGRTARVVAAGTDTIATAIATGTLRSPIISTRSHSAELMWALNRILADHEEMPQLIIPGACGSFGRIPTLADRFPEARFIVTGTVDQGDRVNLLLYFVLEGLGKKIETWQQLRDDMRKRIPAIVDEHVFPDDISQVLLYLIQQREARPAA